MREILYTFYMATFSVYVYTYFLFVWRQIVFCTAFVYCITLSTCFDQNQ